MHAAAAVSLNGAEGESAAGRRKELYGLLGDLPDRNRKISVRQISTQSRKAYMLEKLELDLNGLEPVPAYFVRPHNASGRLPAMLFHHSHGGGYKIGKDEFVDGRSYLHTPPYAEVITSMGWCGLCCDTWVFGERATRTELDCFKDMLWHGQVLWGMMVYDSLRAMDYLVSRPDVDPARIATLGMSMGSTAAWWLAALDERVKVTVDICCLTDFAALMETNNLKGHGVYYYVPRLLKHFTAAQINALIAPRAHLGLAGDLDPLTPPAGLDRIDAELRQVYQAGGHPERWSLFRSRETSHQETPEMRTEILRFLQKFV
ncbi:MAG: acetylxylan esterase [Bryobacteraceae bacterium]|nr:acetylxylan esterase [Bryobacteraceae bacterium]